MKFTLFTAVLFSVWMNAADGDGCTADGCHIVSNTRIPFKNIEDYEMQDPHLCRIRAVRFLTRKGIHICSDPDDSWAIRAINDVNCRKNKGPCVKSTVCSTSTTTTIPTTTTTSKSLGPETETSTSTTEPPKVTRIDTLQLETETSESTTDHPDCCLTVTNTRTDEDIVDYHIQDSSLCPIRAVRFITVENNTICSSPAEEWVQDYIQNLSRRNTSTDTLQLDGLSEEEKQTTEINHPYSNNKYFCLKKKPVQYFCIKLP